MQVAGGTIPVASSHLYMEPWLNPDTAKIRLDYERLYRWDRIAIFILQMLIRQHCRLSICDYWLSWTNTDYNGYNDYRDSDLNG